LWQTKLFHQLWILLTVPPEYWHPHDPAMRIATWDRPGEQVLDERMASQPTQSRLTDIVSLYKENLETVRNALADWVARHLPFFRPHEEEETPWIN